MNSTGNRNFLFMMLATFSLYISACNQPQQVARVNHTLEGCFGASSDELIIYKKDSGLVAKFSTDGKLLAETIVRKGQLDSFSIFFSELKNYPAKSGGCTTEETYNVSYDGEKVFKGGNLCSFYGYNSLKASLFPNMSE